MPFYTDEFLTIFLPVVIVGFYVLYYLGMRSWLPGWMIGASLWYYSSFGWRESVVLVLMLAVNRFGVKKLVDFYCAQNVLAWIIVFNLGVLAFFKYFPGVGMPIGLSFYTFQLIAYAVDIYRKKVSYGTLAEYLGFVLFFPQLVAGPIVHFRQLAKQFTNWRFGGCCKEISTAFFFFSVGLFKKVCLADMYAGFADSAFAKTGSGLSGMEAWEGALAYGLQIYFDFSAYSEMAIGLGLLFGIRLPINFLSPYRAVGARDFWRRWHITLSSFFRDYLYIPLGGSHQGVVITVRNTILVMTLAGIWHGSGWNFVLWGWFYGVWIALEHSMEHVGNIKHRLQRFYVLQRGLTFLLIMLLWVLFRSENLSDAIEYYRTMLTGWQEWKDNTILWHNATVLWLLVGLGIVWFLPNMKQMTGYEEKSDFRLPTLGIWHGILAGILFWMSLKTLGDAPSRMFIYFAF